MLRLQTAAAAGLLTLFIALSSVASPPENTTIDDCVIKKSAVEFPHAAHFELAECSSCHHTQQKLSAESAEKVKPCSECHNEPKKAGTPSCAEASLKKNHFHINCVDCHKEQKAGPTKCNDCHPKN